MIDIRAFELAEVGVENCVTIDIGVMKETIFAPTGYGGNHTLQIIWTSSYRDGTAVFGETGMKKVEAKIDVGGYFLSLKEV